MDKSEGILFLYIGNIMLLNIMLQYYFLCLLPCLLITTLLVTIDDFVINSIFIFIFSIQLRLFNAFDYMNGYCEMKIGM